MRSEFEKLPEIKERLHTVVFNEQFNDYHAAMINSGLSVYYVRGAWYAFQEQQKRIDRLKNYLIVSCAFEDEYIEELLK